MGQAPASLREPHWRALMQRVQEADKQAYNSLLGEVTPVLRAFVRRRLFDGSQVEDVVQDILLALHRARHSYAPGQPFTPWLFSIARHRLIDAMRKHAHKAKREQLAFDIEEFESLAADSQPYNGPPSEPGTQDPRMDAVNAALLQIPARQREAALLLKQEGLSVREAAQKMGVSESALKVLAHRGYKALKALLVKGDEKPMKGK